ncbi:hypothetical protein KX816_05220 [Sphingosinicellaceae bacterium]|nr:hypothetical protein KX816_05220 [Sphingosinicellaceae bacterium]
MIPKLIDESESHCFVVDERNGLWVLFASRDAMTRGGVVQPLWCREAADRTTLSALLRWAAMRRDQWAAWGRLGEATGSEVLNLHLQNLLDADPIAVVVGTVMQRGEDPCVVVLGEMLSSGHGSGFEVLHRHTFASTTARSRFFDWLNADDNMHAVEELAFLAYNHGTDTIDATMDRIAALPVAAPPERIRARRKQPTAMS